MTLSTGQIEELVKALEKLAREHLQFCTYFEDCDHAAQQEARDTLSRARQRGKGDGDER